MTAQADEFAGEARGGVDVDTEAAADGLEVEPDLAAVADPDLEDLTELPVDDIEGDDVIGADDDISLDVEDSAEVAADTPDEAEGDAQDPAKASAVAGPAGPAAAVAGKPAAEAEAEDETFVYGDDDEDLPAAQVAVAGATSDPVKDYLKQIGKVPLLNAEQEVELAKRIEAGLFAEEKLGEGREKALRVEARLDLEWIADDGRRAKN
ncbi:MAG: sigma-70 factor domain-containing protein, partial [Streptosporangiaceae bacterium]